MKLLSVVHRVCGAAFRQTTVLGVVAFAAKLLWREGLQAVGWVEVAGKLVALAAEWLSGQG